MNEDTELQELIKAFELLNKPKPIEYEYRLYYNNEGVITHTTNLKSNEILHGNYVIVDESIHSNFTAYRIENGIPKLIPKSVGYVKPGLIRSEKGIAVVKNHVNLPLMTSENYSETEYYDYRSNRHS